MPEIQSVLCALDFRKELLDRIDRAFAPAIVHHVSIRDDEAIRRVIHEVDVAVLPDDLDERILEGERLRWVHCCHAGLTKSARPEVFERGIILTGAAGRSAPSLAEHAFFFMLALTYDAWRLHEAQQAHDWGRFSRQYAASRGLNGQTLGIVGLGNTGRAVARRAKAFDMRVLAYSRRVRETMPEDVDAYYAADAGDTVRPLLEACDYLVLCCHLSDETYHLIGRRELACMKPTAFLINLARGAVVDQAALFEALRGRVIAGAASDVFETEPLPADDPLWDLDNFLITPHATPRVADFQGNSTAALFENIRRYRSGEPLLNRFTERDVYTGGNLRPQRGV